MKRKKVSSLREFRAVLPRLKYWMKEFLFWKWKKKKILMLQILLRGNFVMTCRLNNHRRPKVSWAVRLFNPNLINFGRDAERELWGFVWNIQWPFVVSIFSNRSPVRSFERPQQNAKSDWRKATEVLNHADPLSLHHYYTQRFSSRNSAG